MGGSSIAEQQKTAERIAQEELLRNARWEEHVGWVDNNGNVIQEPIKELKPKRYRAYYDPIITTKEFEANSEAEAKSIGLELLKQAMTEKALTLHKGNEVVFERIETQRREERRLPEFPNPFTWRR